MIALKYLKLMISLFLLLFSLQAVTANINVTIVEAGKIISYYDQYYVYQINGTVDVINPTNYSLYNIEIPYYVSTLDVRSNQSTGTQEYMSSSRIYISDIDPGESVSFEYKIVGITTVDLSPAGGSVLYNGILASQPKIYANLFGTLKKAPIEDETYTGNPSTRLISVEFQNPTDLNYTLAQVDVIKTNSMDPNAQLAKWSFTDQKSVLRAGEGWAFDFLDDNAIEGEIYWLSTDIFISEIRFNSTANISRYNQEDLFFLTPNATLNETIPEEDLEFLADRIYLRKTVSSALVSPGDDINVTVIVNNFLPEIVEATVYDAVPSGFEVVKIDEGTLNDTNVTWEVKIQPNTLKRLRYQLKYIDEDSLGLDHFRPALLNYNGNVYHSQSLPFVRKYVPQNRVFVQKKVKFLAGEEVQITLSVQNLGETSVENVVIKEHLLSHAEFREITQAPEQRGLWRIETLDQNEIWETTYITDKATVLNTMPEVFGLPSASVMQTIILSSLISSSFSLDPTNIIEVGSVVLLGIIIVLYFLPANFFSRTRRKQTKELKVISKELEALRGSTGNIQQSLHQHQTAPPPQQPSGPQPIVQKRSLHDPARQARHAALDETAKMIEKSKEEVIGKDEAAKKKFEKK